MRRVSASTVRELRPTDTYRATEIDRHSIDDLRNVVRAAVARFAGHYHFRTAALQDAKAHSPQVMAAEFAQFIEPLLPQPLAQPSPTANTGTPSTGPELDKK